MIGTYVSAALICVASLLVGRALLVLAGRSSWSWLEPAVGFGAVLTVTGALARAPGHGTSATLGLALLLIAAIVVLIAAGGGENGAPRASSAPRRRGGPPRGRPGAPAAPPVLSLPFV